MSSLKRANCVLFAVVSVVSIFGAAGCQPESGSDTEAIGRQASKTVLGATCSGLKTKAFVQATGSSEGAARRFLQREIENKNEDVEKFDFKCTTPNGRAATYVQCSAFEKFTTNDNWVTKEILSDGNFRDATANGDLEKVVEEMKADKTVFRNVSISKVLPREQNARESDSGEVVWRLTYQVPGC